MSNLSEYSHLLSPRPKWNSKVICCVRSRVTRYLLLWSFAVMIVFSFLDITNAFKYKFNYFSTPSLVAVVLCLTAVIAAPVAGLLTDLKYNRYKAMICSSCFLMAAGIAYCVVFFTIAGLVASKEIEGSREFQLADTLTQLAFGTIGLVTILMFMINFIRFSMDQLQNSSTEDSILFIHWYVWIYYFCLTVTNFLTTLTDSFSFAYIVNKNQILAISSTVSVFIVILTISPIVAKFKKSSLLIEPPGVNPYKLVSGVTKFAYQHKVPLRRSAFTFCEDELPSRMDLGKQKYGGPFTTKEVEDVKAFWGILTVVFSTGPVYMLQVAAQAILPLFAEHNKVYHLNISPSNFTSTERVHSEQTIFLSNGLLYPLFVVVSIPLYLCIIRPHFSYFLPSTSKRIGLGIILLMISLTLSLAVDVAVHATETDTPCMFQGFTHNAKGYTSIDVWNSSNITHPLHQNVYFFTCQHCLSAIANMLIDIAVLEFILSQSPYSMKGLLLGYFYTMKSLFQAIAAASLFPFGRLWDVQVLSCGSGFYLMNIVLGVLALALFSITAKRYKYRIVNEPSNEYRFAEEYYSNIH